MPRLHSRRAMRRRQESMHIKAYTGLSLCDLDHIPEERMAEAFAAVCADPHVLLAYHTISGRGCASFTLFSLKTAVPSRTPTLPIGRRSGSTREGYRQGNELFARLAGLEYDSSCKNPERISGTAYDPDAYYNPEAPAAPGQAAACSLRETGSAERTEGETGTLYRNGGQGGRGVRKTAGGRRNPL